MEVESEKASLDGKGQLLHYVGVFLGWARSCTKRTCTFHRAKSTVNDSLTKGARRKTLFSKKRKRSAAFVCQNHFFLVAMLAAGACSQIPPAPPLPLRPFPFVPSQQLQSEWVFPEAS